VVPHKAVLLASHKEEGRKYRLDVDGGTQKTKGWGHGPPAGAGCLERTQVGDHREEVLAMF